jgi:hypothetical protein
MQRVVSNPPSVGVGVLLRKKLLNILRSDFVLWVVNTKIYWVNSNLVFLGTLYCTMYLQFISYAQIFVPTAEH